MPLPFRSFSKLQIQTRIEYLKELDGERGELYERYRCVL